MGYAHIKNLYADQEVLMFREVFAMEKIHGTSSSVGFKAGEPLWLHSGGAKHAQFEACFDLPALTAAFMALGHPSITVYGEAYGGNMQAMKDVYGGTLKFCAFDVQIGGHWLSVPDAENVARGLGLDFVPYRKVPATVEALDAERDRPSEQAVKLGFTEPKLREGIVIRPLMELTKNDGERIVAKHKGEAFAERIHTPKVAPDKLVVLSEATAVADEWVTEMRLAHVLDRLQASGVDLSGPQATPLVIAAMVENVCREAAGEIEDTKDVRRAISGRAAKMFKARLQNALKD
jgi:hypothetical protein